MIKIIQVLSWIITLAFLASLVWALYQSIAGRNPLPLWVWGGVLVLLAVVIGLLVMVVVYRGVSSQTGRFDYRTSTRITGELIVEDRTIDANGANTLSTNIHMMEGVLEISAGSPNVADATFVYDNADWKSPEVEYLVDPTGQGRLIIKELSTHRPAMKQGHSEWVLQLNEGLPMDLKMKFGAGEARLSLAGVQLTSLWVENGVGKLDLDLTASGKKAWMSSSAPASATPASNCRKMWASGYHRPSVSAAFSHKD